MRRHHKTGNAATSLNGLLRFHDGKNTLENLEGVDEQTNEASALFTSFFTNGLRLSLKSTFSESVEQVFWAESIITFATLKKNPSLYNQVEELY